jgi:hypothetical protein
MTNCEVKEGVLDFRSRFAWSAEAMDEFSSGYMRVADGSNSVETNVHQSGDLSDTVV